MMTLLKMENVSEMEAVEMVNDIFRDMDLNQVICNLVVSWHCQILLLIFDIVIYNIFLTVAIGWVDLSSVYYQNLYIIHVIWRY
jgi:hypothetical protein